MRLSKAGYYADLWIYPPVLLALLVVDFRTSHSHFFLHFLVSWLSGILAWTLVEYVMHRFVFHEIRVAVQMHDMHHANPTDFVGSPIWLSLLAFGFGAFIPVWSVAGLEIAAGVVAGLLSGYIWYLVVHDAVHRWRLNERSLLYRAKLRHAAHHYGRQAGNFGVSTGLWDHVFGTAIDRVSGSTARR